MVWRSAYAKRIRSPFFPSLFGCGPLVFGARDGVWLCQWLVEPMHADTAPSSTFYLWRQVALLRPLPEDRGPTEVSAGRKAETDQVFEGISEGFHLPESGRVGPRGKDEVSATVASPSCSVTLLIFFAAAAGAGIVAADFVGVGPHGRRGRDRLVATIQRQLRLRP